MPQYFLSMYEKVKIVSHINILITDVGHIFASSFTVGHLWVEE
jgi:hypothetical protein